MENVFHGSRARRLTTAIVFAAAAAGSSVQALAQHDGPPGIEHPSCTVSDSDSHFAFARGHNPFRGALAGASYGDIFFGGGASSRGISARDTSAAPAANASAPVSVAVPGNSSPGQGGNGQGGNGQGSNGSGSGTPAAGGGTTVVPGASSTPTAPASGRNALAPPAGVTLPIAHSSPAVNPEPASLLLIVTGLGSALAIRRRSRKR